jgi:lipopolysaccharide biosynthesis protein
VGLKVQFEIDAEWYVTTYPFVQATGLSPNDHYRKFGRRLGLHPCAGIPGGVDQPYFPPVEEDVTIAATSESIVVTQQSFAQIGSEEIQSVSQQAWDDVPSPNTTPKEAPQSSEGPGDDEIAPSRLKSTSIQRVDGFNLLDMIAENGGEYPRWSATGGDPQMILKSAVTGLQIKLESGSYIFVFRADSVTGLLQNPRIYLDFGSGFSEQEGQTYVLKEGLVPNEFFVTFSIDSPVTRMRFDPSESVFSCYCQLLNVEGYREIASIYPLRNPDSSKLDLLQVNQKRYFVGGHSDYAYSWNINFSKTKGSRSQHFAPLTTNSVLVPETAPKALAFYLPQFHPFKENDEWWGKGFTEWTNVSKAMPQFAGHHQPRLPGELGFYDLRLPDVMARQIELAKQFGIHGFCFHYYWFDGHRLLEKPIEMFLADKSPAFDFPFCLCWANENWTRRWDGAEQDILMKQSHSIEDHKAVFDDLARFFADKRYIKVGNKPVVVIYRAAIIDNLESLVEIWRTEAIKAGFDGIYLVATNSFDFKDPFSIGFDAICEFPPHGIEAPWVYPLPAFLDATFEGQVFDYDKTIDFSLNRLSGLSGSTQAQNYFPTVMMGWDNEARKPGKGNIFHGATPPEFYRWFSKTLEFSRDNHRGDANFVFVNAWNEWAEGTYLEPDREFGYAYLNSIAAGFRTIQEDDQAAIDIVDAYNARHNKRTADAVVCAHVFYEDLIDEMSATIGNANQTRKLDTIISVPKTWDVHAIQHALDKFKPAFVFRTENVGRDIWPFFNHAEKAIELGYDVACKIHSKKSPHLKDGAAWRKSLFEGLLSPEVIENTISQFSQHPDIGITAPKSSFATCEDHYTIRDSLENIEIILKKFRLSINDAGEFVAGSMFWFRPKAMSRLIRDNMDPAFFGVELGAIDGTVAHAYERVLPSIVMATGFKLKWYDSSHGDNPYR